PQRLGDELHGVDLELDVLGQLHAKVGSAADHVVAVDAAGEALRLHLLQDAAGGQVGDAAGPQAGGGGDQAGQLVAGVQRLLDGPAARVAVGQVVGVRQDGGEDALGVAGLA